MGRLGSQTCTPAACNSQLEMPSLSVKAALGATNIEKAKPQPQWGEICFQESAHHNADLQILRSTLKVERALQVNVPRVPLAS